MNLTSLDLGTLLILCGTGLTGSIWYHKKVYYWSSDFGLARRTDPSFRRIASSDFFEYQMMPWRIFYNDGVTGTFHTACFSSCVLWFTRIYLSYLGHLRNRRWRSLGALGRGFCSTELIIDSMLISNHHVLRY